MATLPKIERFVPQGGASLVEDAPGWASGKTDLPSTMLGPVCWKCRGSGASKHKKRKLEEAQSSECSVCQGRGRLPRKKAEALAADRPGMITRGRRHRAGWMPEGPVPHALKDPNNGKWAGGAQRANEKGADVTFDLIDANDVPDWIPRQGEELCNLVGSWRILQRVSSHRWTTDDLVTAYVASQEAALLPTSPSILEYLDLGTGNGSVLQMVTWGLLKHNRSVSATGIEARQEAVSLARRSLSYNVGPSKQVSMRIIHGDFRDVEMQARFDLITGTPPYFRVDFSVNQYQSLVTSAVINQGGMPTSRQSAPARCEFRGGIEAYCDAASRCLKPDDGRFIVCENWLNHDRVVAAAQQSRMNIVRQLQVKGRQGRDTLFAVYVMKLSTTEPRPTSEADDEETLTVRDYRGQWTKEYSETVLAAMSIPNPGED